MHILILPSYYPSPERPITGIFFHEQALALKKAGHKVGILVTPRLDVTRHYARRVGIRNFQATSHEGYFPEFPVYRMHWGWFPRPFPPLVALFVRQAGLRAFELYCQKHGTPDVIHAHNIFYGGYLASQIKQRFGMPFILTEHSTSYMEGLTIFPGQPRIIRQTLRDCNSAFAVSTALADKMHPFAPEISIGAIGNIIDTDYFTPNPSAKSNDFTFAIIGTLEPRKRQSLMLDAFATYFKDRPVYLRMGGDGRDRPQIEQQIERLGLQKQVTMLGRLNREQVRDTVQHCHVFISCSVIESFGITLIEAMACGKPIIATNSGGPADFITQQTGILIPTDNILALGEAMERMIATYENYDPTLIREHVIARYSEPVYVQKLEEIYQRIK